ncbi:hypothetical protein DFJ73DRAFT_603138, partial [Zopfochytrium polystomum]
RVLIIGAGTAGPALALALKRAGHEVDVFERTTEPTSATGDWQPRDAGGLFTAHPNFQRVLKRLGVLDEVAASSVRYDVVDYLNFDGSAVASLPVINRKDELRMFGVLRSAVSTAICSAMNKEGVRVHGGKKLVAIEQPAEGGGLGVRAVFEDGSTADGDILVGADGINSGVRRALFPEVKPVRSDYVGYIGVSEHDGHGETIGRTNDHFTFVADFLTGRSGYAGVVAPGRTSWCVFESRAGGEIEHDSWTPAADVEGEKQRLIEMATRWGLPGWFLHMMSKTIRIVPVSFSALEPMAAWHKHNCVLLGDAAHAILPFIGNGAAIALEDAEVLATLLEKIPNDPQRVFELFYEIRSPRVTQM